MGRQAEVAALDAALRGATEGHGGLWLVSGEPGIGKSRLAEEMAQRAREHGVTVAWGRASEVGGAPALWPWTEVLRVLRRRVDGLFADEGRSNIVAALLPELGGGETGVLAPAHARFRLLDAVVGVLVDAAEEGPLAIILEDLHAADPATLSVLELLAPVVVGSPLVVVGTHRDVGRADTPTAQQLRRVSRIAERLPLSRLQREDIAALIDAAGSTPDAAVVDAVFAGSEGVPLFAAELARSVGTVGSDALPPTLRALVDDRLASISADTRATLDVAAVLGREPSVSILAAVRECSHDEAIATLDAIAVHGILERRPPDTARFVHVLVRDALYADIPLPRRAALHLRCADALAARAEGPQPPWESIAEHLLLAGPEYGARALEASICAAERAMAVHAFDDAARWLNTARERLEQGQPDPVRRVEILLLQGRAYIFGGEVELGRRICAEAAEVARAIERPELVARAALEYGGLFIVGAVDDFLVDLLRQALGGLGEGEPALRARLLARLAAALQPAAPTSGPIAMAYEAVELARGLGDPETLLEALSSGGSALADLEDPIKRRRHDREHLALAERLGNTVEAHRAAQRLLFDCLELGDAAGAETAVVACEQRAAEQGVPHALWRAHATRAMFEVYQGRFAAAEEACARAQRLASQVRDPNGAALEAQRMMAALLHDDLRAARAHGERHIEARGGDDLLATALDCYINSIERQRGREVELPKVDLLVELARGYDDPSLAAVVTEVALALRDEELARLVIGLLEPRKDLHACFGMVCMYTGPPHAISLGRLHRMLGELDESRDYFAHARVLVEHARSAPFAIWVDLAEADYPVAEVTDDSRALVERARERARQLGMDGLVDKLTQYLGADEADAPAPAPTPTSTPTPTPAEVDDGEVIALDQLGETWELTAFGKTTHLRDTKGVRILSLLLASPGREFHVLELLSPGEGRVADSDAGEHLDQQAREAYRRRIEVLREDIAEAEEWNDAVRGDKARAELEALTQELTRAVGLGGRVRRSGSVAERARINVQRRLRDVQRRLAESHSPAADHLAQALQTGMHCVYRPT